MKNNSLKILIKAILAGIMISIGCIIYSACASKLFGAVLFSFGLFTICVYGLNLYTGKIGYLVSNRTKDYALELLLTLVGNLTGTFFAANVMKLTRMTATLDSFIPGIVATKNSDAFLSLLVLSFFCGMLMFLGVDIFKTSDNPVAKVLAVVFAVTIFILAGFEHCVANMFYMFYAGDFDVLRMLVMVIGNSIGGMFAAFCIKVTRND